jgi:hypothetical protein
VIDIANPASPHIVGSVHTPDHAYGVAVSGTHAYVADWGSGLQVIDITSPQSPQIVGGVDTPDAARGVAVSGTHAYIAGIESGLTILPTQCEGSGVGEDPRVASTMLLKTYPNPASCHTFIRFETRDGGLVQAGVYDLAGRRVRALSDGNLSTGVHDLLWDGRNEEGRAVAAGIYLVRVSTAEGATTARFVIVR